MLRSLEAIAGRRSSVVLPTSVYEVRQVLTAACSRPLFESPVQHEAPGGPMACDQCAEARVMCLPCDDGGSSGSDTGEDDSFVELTPAALLRFGIATVVAGFRCARTGFVPRLCAIGGQASWSPRPSYQEGGWWRHGW